MPTRPLPTQPALAAEVGLHAPAAADQSWLVLVEGRPHARVSSDVARVLGLLDGRRTRADLIDELGAPWTSHALDTLLARFVAAGLLDDGRHRRALDRWVAFRPPLTIQFTLGNPSRLLARGRGALDVVISRPGALTAALLAVSGLAALGFLLPSAADVLSSPLQLSNAVWLALAMLVVTVLHELGHGAVLTHFGGRPNRLGFMLFYLTPAFFCDVTDGWRLPDRRQRVAVALAGAGVHCVVGGLAAWAALASSTDSIQHGLLVFSMACYAISLTNLVPLVRLDGYLALMSYLDIPHLRTKAMADARHALIDRLFGGRHSRKLPQFRWTVPYGLACMSFPVVLVGLALQRWALGFAGASAAGALIFLALIALVCCLAGRSAWRTVREGWSTATSRRRAAAATALLITGITALGALVPLPYHVTGGYVAEGDRLRLILPVGGDTAPVRPGVRVELQTQGVLWHRHVATSMVRQGRPRPTTAPATAFLPLDTAETLLPAVSYPLALTSPLPPGHTNVGRVRVEAEHVPAAVWIWRTYLSPPLRALAQ